MMGSMDRGVMGVHSHHDSWPDPGVVTHHVGGVGHALADLSALGGDHLLAVLYGGHVNMLGTHSPANYRGIVSLSHIFLHAEKISILYISNSQTYRVYINNRLYRSSHLSY